MVNCYGQHGRRVSRWLEVGEMIAPGSALSFRPRRIIGEINRKKSLLFVNKKKQKNFVNLEVGCIGLSKARPNLFE